jgi:hypothetical protein
MRSYRSLQVRVPEDNEELQVCRQVVRNIQLRKYFMMNWTAGTDQMNDYTLVTRGRRTNEWFNANKDRIRSAAMGKGAPQDYELALEWAVRSGKVANPTQVSLQRYCDEHLGIDCSGFVTNYLVAVGKRAYSAATVRNTGAASYYQVGRAVNDPSSVRQGDILVWMRNGSVMRGPGHVAVVQSYRPASVAGGNMCVVEATGAAGANPKLLDSMYTVERIIEPNGRRLRNRVMILEVKRHGRSGSHVSVMRY